MENDIFNKILLLVILLLIANFLSNGTIYDIIKKYYNKIINYFINKENFEDTYKHIQNKEWKGKMFDGLKSCDNTTPKIVHDGSFKQIYQKNNLNQLSILVFD